jgi:hypothetical protein
LILHPSRDLQLLSTIWKKCVSEIVQEERRGGGIVRCEIQEANFKNKERTEIGQRGEYL